MGLNYNWRCKVCEQVNLAGTPNCAHCGFRAVSAPIEVNAEIASQTGKALSEGERAGFEFFEELSDLPWWRRTLVISLQLIALICGFVVKFALLSLYGLVALVGLVFSLIALCFITADTPVDREPRRRILEKP